MAQINTNLLMYLMYLMLSNDQNQWVISTSMVQYYVLYFLQSCAPFQHFPSSATLALNLWMVLKAITYLKRFFLQIHPLHHDRAKQENNQNTLRSCPNLPNYPQHYIKTNNPIKTNLQFFSQKFYHQHHPDIGILFLVSSFE